MTSQVLLQANNLCAGYGRGTSKDILHDISFTLHFGERLCIIGPNGCGKTTLLRVLAGILPYRGSLSIRPADSDHPHSGKLIDRETLTIRQAARETALITQLSPPVYPYTVFQTVMLGRYARQGNGWRRSSSNEDTEKTEKAIADCGISNLSNHLLTELSGGQLQRVYLARALAQDPTTLLLDEPTNHLDLYFQLDILDRTSSGIARGRPLAAIGVFHDLFLTRRFADTLILMDNGTIADMGTTEEVLSGKAINRVYRMDVPRALSQLSKSR